MRPILITAATLLVLTGCTLPLDESIDPYASPDALVAGLVSSWENLDYSVYRDRVLYDDAETTSDGRAYEAFAFYFIEAQDGYGEGWDLGEELEHVARLLSGQPSGDGYYGGLRSVELDFSPVGDWEEPEGDEIHGDDFPEGLIGRRYATDLSIVLDGAGGSSGIEALEIGDLVDFYVIPVDGIDGQGYRLWKWQDVSAEARSSSSMTWSELKLAW